jgi:hypothetical protein
MDVLKFQNAINLKFNLRGKLLNADMTKRHQLKCRYLCNSSMKYTA